MTKNTFKTIIILIVLLTTVSTALADQPKMHDALKALSTAEQKLLKGSHDKGGHRVKALKLVRKAKKQVKLAMKFDRQH
jgi:hypothetical protein